MKNMKRIRITLAILAVVLIVVPLMIVSITGIGWGAIASQIVVSLSILCAMGAIALGTKKGTKGHFAKIGACIGLLIVLISVWV